MFPLFDTIYKQTESTDLSIPHQERLDLAEQISQLDKSGHEYIYAIIRNYQLELDQEDFNELPYKVRLKRQGMKWEMQKLPPRLLVMIRHFVFLHLQKLQEETQRTTFFEKKGQNWNFLKSPK